MSKKREKRKRWCKEKRSESDIEVDAGRIVREKHPALDHPAISATYTGWAYDPVTGEVRMFTDGVPGIFQKDYYERARKAGY